MAQDAFPKAPATARYTVLRGLYMHGQAHRPGDVVELTPAQYAESANAGKVGPLQSAQEAAQEAAPAAPAKATKAKAAAPAAAQAAADPVADPEA